MISIRMRTRRLGVWAVAVALAACGGGGSDSGGNNGGGSQAGGFTISANSVSFAAKINGPAPSAHFIAVHLTDTSTGQIAAGYRSGVTPASWLNVSASGSGFDYELTLSVKVAGLTAGSYSTTLTVTTQDGSGNTLQAKDVQVAFSLREGVSITSPPPRANATNGSSIQSTQTLHFTVASPTNIQWTAASSVPWLSVPAGTKQGPGVFDLTVNFSTLPPAVHLGRLTITNVADPTDNAEIFVEAESRPATLTVSASQLLLGGASGLEIGAVPFTFSLNTALNAHPWTVQTSTSSGGDWLRASAVSGAVGGSNASVSIDADRSQLGAGVYSGTVQLQANVNGQILTRSIPVTLNKDDNRLVVDAAGVAFSSFPGRQTLERELHVFNSWDVATMPWNATSDQSWLSVTPSGTSADPLQLSVDADSLGPGQYFADVTVSSPDHTVANAQTVRVGLLVSATDPTASVDIAADSSLRMVAGPVEPVLFAASGTSIRVYDVYSGALLRTLSGTFGKAAALTISEDGKLLFVVDDSSPSDPVVRVLDPVSGAVHVSYPMTLYSFTTLQEHVLRYMRPNGRPMLLSAGMSPDAIDVATGTRYLAATGGPAVAVSGDQGHVYVQNTGFSPSEVRAYRLRYSTLANVGLRVDRVAANDGHTDLRSNGSDVAVSPDGARLYVAAAGAQERFDILDATTLARSTSLTTEGNPVSVETCWNGLIAGGQNDSVAAADDDIWIYDASGTLRTRLDSGNNPLKARALIFSGDCTRVISASASGLRIQSAL